MAQTFNQWLAVATITDDPAGDFIDDARRDRGFPADVHTLWQLKAYLASRRACIEAVRAAVTVWKRYERETQRRKNDVTVMEKVQ
jgi:hypothetical protein